jgi:hypothetical protein
MALAQETPEETRFKKNQERVHAAWYKKIRKNAKKTMKFTTKNVNFKTVCITKEPNPIKFIRIGDGVFLPVNASVLNSNVDARDEFRMGSGLTETKRIIKIEKSNTEDFFYLDFTEKWPIPGQLEAEARNREWYVEWLKKLGDQRAAMLGELFKMMPKKEDFIRETIFKMKLFNKTQRTDFKRIPQGTLDYLNQWPIVTKTTMAREDGYPMLVRMDFNGQYNRLVKFDPTIRGKFEPMKLFYTTVILCQSIIPSQV